MFLPVFNDKSLYRD